MLYPASGIPPPPPSMLSCFYTKNRQQASPTPGGRKRVLGMGVTCPHPSRAEPKGPCRWINRPRAGKRLVKPLGEQGLVACARPSVWPVQLCSDSSGHPRTGPQEPPECQGGPEFPCFPKVVLLRGGVGSKSEDSAGHFNNRK